MGGILEATKCVERGLRTSFLSIRDVLDARSFFIKEREDGGQVTLAQ